VLTVNCTCNRIVMQHVCKYACPLFETTIKQHILWWKQCLSNNKTKHLLHKWCPYGNSERSHNLSSHMKWMFGYVWHGYIVPVV